MSDEIQPDRSLGSQTRLALTCAKRPVYRCALAFASVSKVRLCRERSAGECVDGSSGYAQVRGKREGRHFTGPRLSIKEAALELIRAWGRAGGKKGARARWAGVSPEQRRALAKKAARARWSKKKG